jgi:hypothetical protein
MRSVRASARRFSIALACLLATTLCTRADIRFGRPENYKLEIFITGTISARDAKALDDVDEEMQRKLVNVYLNSLGGDVLAAIKIGRIVRKSEGKTYIGFDDSLPLVSKCYGSCALIFISGVRRSAQVLCELGLHRPFLAAAPQTREAVEKQVPQMLSMVKSYIAEMGITDTFYQQMVNTEPSRMVIYRGNQFKRIIPEQDPIYEETPIAWEARTYGATTMEMRNRN